MAAANSRDVILNVYDLTDEHGTGTWMRGVGLGTYHSGVEISGVEYTFGDKGIFLHEPKKVPVGQGQVVTLKESIMMGTHHGSANDVHAVVSKLRAEFDEPGAYHPVKKNCNAFSERFVQELIGEKIPAWINRPARIGSWFTWGSAKRSVDESVSVGGAGGAKASTKKKELTEQQRMMLESVRRQGSKTADA